MTGQVNMGLVMSDNSRRKVFGPKIFGSQIFLDPKCLWNQYFVGSKILLDQILSMTQKSFMTFLTQNFFGTTRGAVTGMRTQSFVLWIRREIISTNYSIPTFDAQKPKC